MSNNIEKLYMDYTVGDIYDLIIRFQNKFINIQRFNAHTENEKKVVKQIGDTIFQRSLENIIKHMSRCKRCNKCIGLDKHNGNNMCVICNRCSGRNILILINRIKFLYEYGIDCAMEYIQIDKHSKLKHVNSYIFM
jgi:hypothetical protein